jgi:hypothetical protein
VTEKDRQIPGDVFDRLWHSSFYAVARDANDRNSYTARRFILQCRLGDADRSMVFWTKIGVLLSLVTSSASLMVSVLNSK